VTGRRKLIEVALPLDAINRESAREKSIRHGHPSTLHLWWARRPLAACRAVLFAQLVDDPSARPNEFPTEEAQETERQRLFDLIERLVRWESSNDEAVLAEARAEIRRCFDGDPPPVLDPFAGGGSIPLEAQRLGLEAHASDLNPVAVLINKALIEIPPRWADQPPVHPSEDDLQFELATWRGAQGLAEDVRHYGRWMRDEAERRLGHLYPDAKLEDGSTAKVIAWIWARTVTCPNPACRAEMPLAGSFWLGKKKGKEAWIDPHVVDGRVEFRIGSGPQGPPVGRTAGRNGATCLVCDTPVPLAHVRAEGKAGRMGARLMAVAAEGDRRRLYLPPSPEHEAAADFPPPDGVPATEIPFNARYLTTPNYGMTHHADLFTARQLTTLITLSDLVGEARDRVRHDAEAAGASAAAASAYADAVATYLGLAVSRLTSTNSSLCRWRPDPGKESVNDTFARQAISMVWDYAEGRPFTEGPCSYTWSVTWVARVLDRLVPGMAGDVRQSDAAAPRERSVVIATDPPYYDNVGYADLSDYFYAWQRRTLGALYPHLFGTMLTPKEDELVADPYRFEGDGQAARDFFEEGFVATFQALRERHPDDVPMTVFYAFKQAEADKEGTASTGWETLLSGLFQAGWSVQATWPMRTELGNRMRGIGSNALASSIVLACRPRHADAGVTDRRAFIAALRSELPDALRAMRSGSIAPVDLAQAAIGPGMAVFSRFAKVLESDGQPMRVRTALGLINQVLAEVLDEQEGDVDPDTRWAIKWFDQHGHDEAPSGEAEQLCVTYGVSLRGLADGGILDARGGRTRLLSREELPDGWDPTTDPRISVWEATQHLVKQLETGGESAAGALLRQLGGLGDAARDLAYLLFQVCERRSRAREAIAYNSLGASWAEIARHAAGAPAPAAAPDGPQGQLDI
jgi:putative DNA methylase